MKTAISVPRPLFEEGEATARHLHLTRSELYQRALQEYLRKHSVLLRQEEAERVYAEIDAERDKGLDAWVDLPDGDVP